jgi:NADH-quinone oxidoreductase subunit G
MTGNGKAALTINGQQVEAENNRLLIDVAEELGIYVPRFCYHPGMASVAVCRMCLVKVEGSKKLLPACATPVTDGMVVDTVDPEAVDAQEGMLEFLLINHPLDCPICDRGGECPLQDQTYKHGPGTSRYVEAKRTYEKPLEISDLVVLDRERCVLCWRCVRFSDEVAGDAFIQLIDRGAGTQVLTFKDDPFDSYFSGNTIQICPVGALLSKPYRFVSRPWDLTSAPSVCSYCAVGCPLTNEARAGKVVRCQALPNENVNDFWVCDKGRFGYHYVSSEERLVTPLVRNESDEFEAAGWARAVDAVAAPLRQASRIGVIAGAHLTTEDAFAISKLAKRTLGTRDVDSRLQDAGAPYERAAALGGVAGSTATLNDLESARTIVWAGPDPKEVLPVLYLRLRKSVIERSAKLIVVSPRRISLDAIATHVIRCDAGEEVEALEGVMWGFDAVVARDVGDPLVVCWGPASPGRDEGPILDAVVALARNKSGKLLVCPPHAGSQGMIDMGVHPALDPGYAPSEVRGQDTRAILEAAAAGRLDVLLLFGADPIADFPDADLAARALAGAAFTLAVELFPTASVAHADVVFPSAAYAEREGTFTNLERRIQKLEPLTEAPGSAAEPWRICARIAQSLGEGWGWTSFEDVWDEIRSTVPTHASVDLGRAGQATPPAALQYESPFRRDPSDGRTGMAGPGAGYPKGHRSGSPYHTGQNWPLSWELRGFEARQRPGFIPPIRPEEPGGSRTGGEDGESPGAKAKESGVPKRSGGSSPAVTWHRVSDEFPSFEEGRRRFVLYTGRLLYDEGAMVSKTTALRSLARRPFIELNEDDAKELGLSEGDEAVVGANGLSATLEVRLADIAPGAVFVPLDQPGWRANSIIRGINPMVEVRRR